MSDNKNAYEIRLSVLQEAMGLLMVNRDQLITKLQIDAEKCCCNRSHRQLLRAAYPDQSVPAL